MPRQDNTNAGDSMQGRSDTHTLEALLDGDADATALVVDEWRMSRGDLRRAGAGAAAMLAARGYRRGDALALWLPNGPVWMQLLFAAARLGVLIVPISTRYKTAEVRHLLTVSRARGIVVARHFLDIDYGAIATGLQAEVETLDEVIELADFNRFIEAGNAPPAPATGTVADALCCFSTSGTTGFPKLAVHDHAGIARHAAHVAGALGVERGDAMLLVLPLYGVFGFVAALGTLAGGGACVFMPVFDAADVARAVPRHRITHFAGSDAMFDAVFRIEGADFSTWKRGALADFVGLPLQVTRRAEDFGIHLSGTYGSSECFALMSLHPPQEGTEERARAGGVPVDPAIEVRVVDPDTGAARAQGVPGEIQIRGPNVLTGYLHNREATAKAMTPDGWYRSGDLGYLDVRGFVYLARMGDSLRLRGYLVNPAEIETCLMQHASVSGAQVVGVNRPGEGDIAVAYVLAGDGAPEEAVLLAHCRERMAAYKVPRRIVTLDAFPSINGPNGIKIQKRTLREMAQALV
jgi:fatty-acyl-CoA synthase